MAVFMEIRTLILVGLTALNRGLDVSRASEDRFIVPFQRNPKFTGRTELMQKLEEKLSTQVPRQYNHRVALYGMGGVGKKQCAAEYVYSNRHRYDRIYWITAVNEASIMSGYQRIAKAAKDSLNDVTSRSPKQFYPG